MKLATHMTFAAAALLAAAATGSAQTMTAEIPFACYAGNTLMAPGSYQVHVARTSGSTLYLNMLNQDNHRRIIVLPTTVEQPRGEVRENAVLTFRRTGDRYELAQIWDGSVQLLSFRLRRAQADATLAHVVMKPDRGE